MRKTFFFLVFLCLVSPVSASGDASSIRIDFDNLDGFEHIEFPNNEPTVFEIVEKDDGSVLRMAANATMSGMLYDKTIDIYETPYMTWRWKVSNVYEKGDITEKDTDDSPLRIFLLFDTGPDFESFFARMKYNVFKTFYGDAAPRSSLIYMWGSQERDGRIIEDWESNLINLVLQQQGSGNVGKWMVERANLLEDYRQAFGMEPSHTARLMVSADSDDTEEEAVSCVDFIEFSAAPLPSANGEGIESGMKSPDEPGKDTSQAANASLANAASSE